MTDEREEALHLLRAVEVIVQEHLNICTLSLEQVVRLIRLARAQPQGEPVYCTHDADSSRICERGTKGCELRHTYPPAQAVPEGWVLVPREPTREMLTAMEAVDIPTNPGPEEDGMAWEIASYRAMLSAAPTSPK